MTMGISVAGSILGVVFTNKAYSFVPIKVYYVFFR